MFAASLPPIISESTGPCLPEVVFNIENVDFSSQKVHDVTFLLASLNKIIPLLPCRNICVDASLAELITKKIISLTTVFSKQFAEQLAEKDAEDSVWPPDVTKDIENFKLCASSVTKTVAFLQSNVSSNRFNQLRCYLRLMFYFQR